MKGLYINIPKEYIQSLQNKSKRDKARAFMEYYFDLEHNSLNSIRFYSNGWKIGSSTAQRWVKEFEYEIERYHTFHILKNQQGASSVLKSMGQKRDKTGTNAAQERQLNNIDNIGLKEEFINEEKDNIGAKVGQKRVQDKTINIINNISAELENSTTKNLPLNKSSTSKNNKNSYSSNFEIIWNRYDKKSSNKKRSQNIYAKRWKDTPLEFILQAIEKYKTSIDLTYLKDFDGFLNGLIDSYIPCRVWLVDLDNKKHIGYFYDSENVFISDENKKLNLESSKIASLIEQKRFGYIKGKNEE